MKDNENNKESFELKLKEIKTKIKKDKQFSNKETTNLSLNSLRFSFKLETLLINDYYNCIFKKKFPVIPAAPTINQLIERYSISKHSIYKNISLNSTNSSKSSLILGLTLKSETDDLTHQMTYINDILNQIKLMIERDYNFIIHSKEEKEDLSEQIKKFNSIRNVEEKIVNLLGIDHLVRFIVRIPVIFETANLNKNNKVLFNCVLTDFSNFLEKNIQLNK